MSAARRLGIGLSVAHIAAAFHHPARGAFDPDYMKALFEDAVEQAKNGTAFETIPPDLSLRGPQTDPVR